MVNTSSSARVIRQQAPRSTPAWPRLLVRWIKTGDIRRKSSYLFIYYTPRLSTWYPPHPCTPIHNRHLSTNENYIGKVYLLHDLQEAKLLLHMFIVFIIAFMSKKIWLLIKKLPHPYVFCRYLHLHYNDICRSNNTQLLYKSSPDSSCSTIYIPTNSRHEDTRTYTRSVCFVTHLIWIGINSKCCCVKTVQYRGHLAVTWP